MKTLKGSARAINDRPLSEPAQFWGMSSSSIGIGARTARVVQDQRLTACDRLLDIGHRAPQAKGGRASQRPGARFCANGVLIKDRPSTGLEPGTAIALSPYGWLALACCGSSDIIVLRGPAAILGFTAS